MIKPLYPYERIPWHKYCYDEIAPDGEKQSRLNDLYVKRYIFRWGWFLDSLAPHFREFIYENVFLNLVRDRETAILVLDWMARDKESKRSKQPVLNEDFIKITTHSENEYLKGKWVVKCHTCGEPIVSDYTTKYSYEKIHCDSCIAHLNISEKTRIGLDKIEYYNKWVNELYKRKKIKKIIKKKILKEYGKY